MKSADTWFQEYGASHQNPTNKAIHWVCVPAILFASIGLFWAIPAPDAFGAILPGRYSPLVNWGSVLVVVALIFYLRMSFSIFLGMLLVSAASLWGNLLIVESGGAPLWKVSLGIFLVAWVFQFIGHKIEGQKPSFFQDLQFLLVGPAWLLHFIYKKLGVPY
jgi:uncharacterized membrane protein YGL010W